MATHGYTYTATSPGTYSVRANGVHVGTVTGQRGAWRATATNNGGATATGPTRAAAMHTAIAATCAPAPKAARPVPASKPRKPTVTASVPQVPAPASTAIPTPAPHAHQWANGMCTVVGCTVLYVPAVHGTAGPLHSTRTPAWCANCNVTTAPTGCMHCSQYGACGSCGWHVCSNGGPVCGNCTWVGACNGACTMGGPCTVCGTNNTACTVCGWCYVCTMCTGCQAGNRMCASCGSTQCTIAAHAPAPAPVLCTWPSGLHRMRGGRCTRCGHVANAVAAPVRAPQHTAPAPTPTPAPQGHSGPRTALLWAVWALAAVCTVLALVLRGPATMYGKAAQLATRASVALRTYARTL